MPESGALGWDWDPAGLAARGQPWDKGQHPLLQQDTLHSTATPQQNVPCKALGAKGAGGSQDGSVSGPEGARAKAQGKGPAFVLTNPLQAKPSPLCTATAIIWVFLVLFGQGEALVEVKPFLVTFPKTNP